MPTLVKIGNVKGPRGDSYRNARIVSDGLVFDRVTVGPAGETSTSVSVGNVRGAKGDQGLPGVNAVENDTAVAAYVANTVSATRGALEGAIEDAAGLPTVQPTLAKLARGSEDVTILVISDSTATENWEWVYLTAQRMAADWPTHTVQYFMWDNTAKAWPASPVVIQTGTGTRILKFYNLSYAGWSTSDARANYAAGVVAVAPTLVIVSHGHNEPFGALGREYRVTMTSFMEQLSATRPLADLVMVAQNPNRDTNTSGFHAASIVQEICSVGNYGFIDVAQRFLDAGKPANWYMDNVHPNTTGMGEWADVVAAHIKYRPGADQVRRIPSSFTDPRANLLPDGAFLNYVGPGLPSGWVKSASTSTLTVTKDAALYDSAKGYSIKVVSDNTVGGMYYVLPAALAKSLEGQWVTFAARVYSPAAATGDTGRATYLSNLSGESLAPSNWGTQVRDQWRWQTVSYRLPVGAAYHRFYVWTGTEANVDRVVLVRGMRPHETT